MESDGGPALGQSDSVIIAVSRGVYAVGEERQPVEFAGFGGERVSQLPASAWRQHPDCPPDQRSWRFRRRFRRFPGRREQRVCAGPPGVRSTGPEWRVQRRRVRRRRRIRRGIQAFRSCMSSHGETIPSVRPTAPPASGSPGADRFVNGLNPNDPKVAAALKACQSKLPSFASGG